MLFFLQQTSPLMEHQQSYSIDFLWPMFWTFVNGIMFLPGFALLILGWLLHRGMDDFFSLERFFVKYYSRGAGIDDRISGPGGKEFNYYDFARSRGAWMMLLGMVWMSVQIGPSYLDVLAKLYE